MSLYLDLGATHLKVLHNGNVRVFEYLTTPKLDVKQFSDFVKNILGSFKFSKLYTCSQMHGFHIQGAPEYISWMCEDVDPTPSVCLKGTGLYAYHGLPCFNSELYHEGRLCTLVDTLLDEVYHVSHETLECGTGFYDMRQKCQKKSNFALPTVVCEGPVVCGKIGACQVYAPLGDLQCAVMGIDKELEVGDVIINLGTGSQVIQIGMEFRDDTENRPLFKYILNCVTHIPSGRSMKFFSDLFSLPGFSSLNFDDVIKSKEHVNLAYFKSAHDFCGHAAVTHIQEHTTKYTIACSLMRCYVQQYLKVLQRKFSKRSRIFLTGGVAKNIPNIKLWFQHYLPDDFVQVEDNDTLKGLYKYSTYWETQYWFNQEH